MLKLATTFVTITLVTLVHGATREELLAANYEYIPDVGYYYFGTNRNWLWAQEDCMSTGARLAVINSEEEREALVSFLNNHTKEDYVYSGFRNKWESRFVTIEGIPIERTGYATWEIEKPSGGIDRCGGVNTFTGKLTDLPCNDNTKSYVCEHQLWTDYTLVDGVGHYKLHVEAKPWVEAYETCKREGAHLLVIDSEKESDAVMKIYAQNPTFTNANSSDFVFVGFRAVLNDLNSNPYNGTYLTVLGKSVSNLGYVQWYGQEPRPQDKYFCGTLMRNPANYYMKLCNSYYAFICERELQTFKPPYPY